MLPKTVPVVNRKPAPAARPKPKMQLKPASLLALGVVIIIVMAIILVPLRIYMQQRAEIGRVSAQIQANEAEKQRLLDEIEKYNNQAYVREQARLRLGVIEPGETAFRVLDPALEDTTTQLEQTKAEPEQPWFEQLWDSVTIPDN